MHFYVCLSSLKIVLYPPSSYCQLLTAGLRTPVKDSKCPSDCDSGGLQSSQASAVIISPAGPQSVMWPLPSWRGQELLPWKATWKHPRQMSEPPRASLPPRGAAAQLWVSNIGRAFAISPRTTPAHHMREHSSSVPFIHELVLSVMGHCSWSRVRVERESDHTEHDTTLTAVIRQSLRDPPTWRPLVYN